jgi:hypothetical protein
MHNMALDCNISKVLSVEEKVKIMLQIKSGKNEIDVWRKSGLVNSTIQTILKKHSKLCVRMNRNE